MARYSAILIDVNGEVLLDSERILTGPNKHHIVKHIAFENNVILPAYKTSFVYLPNGKKWFVSLLSK